MSYWLHVGSDDFGGDLHGDYDTLEEAGDACKRIAIKCFEEGYGQRAFTIVQGDSKYEALQDAEDRTGFDCGADNFKDDELEDEEGPYECANCGATDHPSSECPQGGHG